MPDLLGHLPASERDSTALALAHFLATLGPRSPAITEAPSATPEQGRTLFFSVGCAACHSTEEALPGSIPLGPLAEKYSFESLTRFLEDPLAARPSSRMPDSHLSGAEAQAIAKYLLGYKPGKPAAFEPDPELAEQGRRFFADYRCSACHDIPGATGDVRGNRFFEGQFRQRLPLGDGRNLARVCIHQRTTFRNQGRTESTADVLHE